MKRGDQPPLPVGGAECFPGEQAGASLKHVSGRATGTGYPCFPGEQAGASLKPVLPRLPEMDRCDVSPVSRPGPH